MKIVLATSNKHKVQEINDIVAGLGIEFILPPEGFDPVEDGETFEENSRIKALAAWEISKNWSLADDSGLCVDVLDGRPGVYTARYAPERDFDKGMDKLIAEIKATGVNNWAAHFSCVLALKMPGKEVRFFEGRVDGKISEHKSGNGGFGFDPVFIPEGFKKTFAEFSNCLLYTLTLPTKLEV